MNFEKIDAIIDELREHPTTGIGKPEILTANRSGQWARRITKKHRLIYEIHNDIVTVVLLSALDHYGDK
ncbi:MAG: Txe/YoeB family addiction module toxin [Bacteroidales bacterium]